MTRLLTALTALAAFAFVLAPLVAEEGHHGAEIALGTKTMGAWQVTANRSGAWEAGKVGAGSVDLVPAKPAAKNVRLWVGSADGKGSVKAKGEAETAHPGGWHCHVEVPNPIPEGAQFWVAIETEAGDQLKESFPLAPTVPKAAGHDHGGGAHTH